MVIRKKNIGSAKPATKGDLEELREDLQADMANMEDRIDKKLAAMETRFDEKLIAMETRFDEKLIAMETRFDEKLIAMETRFNKKLDDWGQILFEKIEGAIENRMFELGGAKIAEVSLLDDKVKNLDERVAVLERQRK
jgi:hypothetical protein